jgi:hypothetical protein
MQEDNNKPFHSLVISGDDLNDEKTKPESPNTLCFMSMAQFEFLSHIAGFNDANGNTYPEYIAKVVVPPAHPELAKLVLDSCKTAAECHAVLEKHGYTLDILPRSQPLVDATPPS